MTRALTPSNGADCAAIVYNPVKVDEQELRAAVAERESKHGWGPSIWLPTTENDPGEGMAREAVARGAKLVIACGGDGTVRSVAAGLEASPAPLGIVPLGTGNLLARNLGIPIGNLDRALAAAMGGTTKMVDLGRVTYTLQGTEHTEVFLVMVGVGMDADIMTNTDEDLKRKVGWVAYVKSGAATVLNGHRIKARYSLDGEAPKDVHCRAVIVGNCGALQGGVVIMPGAQLADGLLDIVTLRPKGLVGWARLGYTVVVHNSFLAKLGVPSAKAWSERVTAELDRAGEAWAELIGTDGARRFHETASNRRQRWAARRAAAATIDNRQAKLVELTVTEGRAQFQIDGDEIGPVSSFRAEVRHRALGLRVPTSSR